MAELLTFSQSKIKTFNRCPKQFDYKYVQNLEPKKRERPLFLGSWVHACIEELYRSGDWKKGHQLYLDQWNKLFDEEKEELSKVRGKPGKPLPQVVEAIMRSYTWYYRNDGWTPIIIEEELNVPTPIGVNFKGRLDLVVRDEEDKNWLVDHKTASSIPDANFFHAMDPQLMLYPWATKKQFGLEIHGIVYNYIKSKAPSLPKINKDGSLSRRKVSTDYPTLMRFFKKNDIDPHQYVHILKPLAKRSDFLRRYRLPREKYVVEEVLKDVLSVVKRILETKRFTRSISKDCKFCPYMDICRAELNGFDTTHMRKMMFEERVEDDGSNIGAELEDEADEDGED